MVASLQQSGQTARGFLDELYQTYGYFQVKETIITPLTNRENVIDEQWLSCLSRPDGRGANFFAAAQL